MGCSFCNDYFVFFPFHPVNICYVTSHLFAKWWQIVLNNFPNSLEFEFIIIVCQNIAHSHYAIPFCLGMFPLEGLCEMISSLTNGKDVIDNGVAHHIIGYHVFVGLAGSIA